MNGALKRQPTFGHVDLAGEAVRSPQTPDVPRCNVDDTAASARLLDIGGFTEVQFEDHWAVLQP